MPFTVHPHDLVEMRVVLNGDLHNEHWMPVEVMSYPDVTHEGAEPRVLVRTWPGVSWSATWVLLRELRAAVFETNK